MRRDLVLLVAVLLLHAGPAAAEVHRLTWSDDPARGSDLVTPAGREHPARLARFLIPADREVDTLTLRILHEAPAGEGAVRVPPANEALDLGDPDGRADGYAYWILDEGDVRGMRVAHVVIESRRRDGDRLLRPTELEVDLALVPSETRALERRVHHPLTAADDARVVSALVGHAIAPTEARRESPPPVPPELEATTVEYVIVTPGAFAAAFEPLAALKTQEGIPARVTTVEWILDHYAGSDAPARIRAYLRDAYLYQGLRFVMLGGDVSQVPIRSALSRYEAPPGGFRILTDKYYACLDGDWNADGDQHIGEAPDPIEDIPGDDADLFPDIAVGRVPVTTPAEVATYVAKWRTYTGHDPSTFRTDYQARMLSLGEVLFPYGWDPGDDPADITTDGADYCEETLEVVPPHIERTRLYEYYWNPELPPGALPETRSAVLAAINEGYGFIDHVGHGFRQNWSVGTGKITNLDADQVSNQHAYSVAYAANCTSTAVRFDCLMEHYILNPGGGTIASIGSTHYDYPFTAERFKKEFFELLFDGGLTTLGDAFYGADLAYAAFAEIRENANRWTLLTFLALGDPGLEVWLDTPRELVVDVEADLVMGDDLVTVTVTDDGSPAESVRVAITKDDGYGVAFTDAAGVAEVPFAPETPGSLTVTATRNGNVPVVIPGSVGAPTGPLLRVDGWTVHDGTAGGGTGNADGRADPGETVVLDLHVRNDGVLDAIPGQATLALVHAAVVVNDGVVDTPHLLPGGPVTIPGAFEVTIDPAGVPAELKHVDVSGEVTFDVDGTTSSDEAILRIRQRHLDLVALEWSISDGDGDPFLEDGELATLSLSVSNLGEAAAPDVTGTIGLAASGFTLLDESTTFGEVASGQTAVGTPVRVRSDGGTAAELRLDLSLSDAIGPGLLDRALDVLAPAPPDSFWFAPTSTAVRLTWATSPATDVRGYHVYRSETPEGPFERVTGDVADHGAYYGDHGLEPLAETWYRVAAVDSSGNEGPLSGIAHGGSSAPPQPGWPVALPPGGTKGSPTIANLDLAGGSEVILGWSYPIVLQADGTDLVDGDDAPLTTGVFADVGGGDTSFWNSPAVADLDGDGVLEVVFTAWQLPGDDVGYLYVIDATGAIEPGWPQEIGSFPWATPVVGDIAGDDGMEIVVPSGAGWGDYQGALFGFHHDGTEILDGDSDPSTHGVFHRAGVATAQWMYGSPGLADIDDDGREEVVFVERTRREPPETSTLKVLDGDGSMVDGFPYGGLTGSTSSPAMADLDGDGRLEIVFATNTAIHVVDSDGDPVPGWPKALTPVPDHIDSIVDFMSSPAIGDVDGDGRLDVALGWMWGEVHLWTGETGDPHPGFPVDVMEFGRETDAYMRSPVIGNVDDDPRPEILVSSGYAELFAITHDGRVAPGFPLQPDGTAFGAPAIGDLDLDGDVDIVIQSDAALAEVYDLDVPYVLEEHPWPAFRNDRRKTGLYRAPTSVDVSDPATVPAAAFVAAARPNPFTPRVSVPFGVPSTGARVTIRVFDVTGREVRVLADGRFPGGRFEVSWDGRTARGMALPAGVYFARATVGEVSSEQRLVLVR